MHPDQALFSGEAVLPTIPVCEHFAGSRKLIEKALAIQAELGPVFDITADCEDGAATGREMDHVSMVANMVLNEANKYGMLGIRIHDPSHSFWRKDVDTILERASEKIAYITIPKATSYAQAMEVSDFIREKTLAHRSSRRIPLHILIETHGALRDVERIAAIDNLQVLDFGLMDFVSAHQGAIRASQMRSPGQFDHPLIARAKANITAAALGNGVIPAHNVCLSLKDPDLVRADAKRARDEFGFLRMWSIHPAQIAPILDAMRPAFHEVLDAVAILALAQEAEWGPIQYKNELHDRATYRYFWSLLKRAKSTGMALPQAAEDRFFRSNSFAPRSSAP
jgi:citrate lyase subunit beta/citryl-CoA lyase